MAATSEEYKIILRVEGEAQLAKLSDEVRKEEKALADLAQRLRAVGATQDQVVKATAVYAQSIASLNQQIAATQKQIGEAGGSTRNLANGLVQLGYAVDDAQYGIKGLANNIQPLLMAFGVTGGLAGIIGIVVTATAVLTDKWGKLMDVMGMGKIKTEADQMKELADQVDRTLEQEAKLEEYGRRKKAGEAVKALPKAQQDALAAGQAGIIEAGGGERMAAGLRSVRETGAGGLNPNAAGYEDYLFEQNRAKNAEKVAVEALGDVSYAPDIRKSAERKMKELREKNLKASKEQALALVDRAANGDQAAYKALIGEVQKNPGAFPPNALRELQKGTPEGQLKDKLDSAFKNMKMDEGQAAMDRTQKSGEAWKNAKIAEGERAMGETEKRSAEVQDYFNNIKEGPDAETQAFLDKQREKAQRRAQRAHSERQSDFQNLGGGGVANDIAAGLLMQGGNATQVYKSLRDRLTGSVGAQEADKMARAATQQGMQNMFSMQWEQMKEAMGPRQIHGLASFKDSVMTSDPMGDLMRKQWEAAKEANAKLANIEELMRNRTFPTVVN